MIRAEENLVLGEIMPERSLQLDDLRDIGSPERIASLFQKLGYNADAQPLDIDDLQLSPRSAEAIYDAYMIAKRPFIK